MDGWRDDFLQGSHPLGNFKSSSSDSAQLAYAKWPHSSTCQDQSDAKFDGLVKHLNHLKLKAAARISSNALKDCKIHLHNQI
ncbi:hypothetical protein O181_004875 [Austropuccinia psidii MF-1]|uniref:Uncharacterized protein n=1 Tax=Austropuccinia psidii MF-1 TaxID=1389203 RepID=A0A9Q3GFA2_9BASI|nr:hypothetical protein [Austropuccinia psidii MF-1]